jgi:hypothetical protein
VARGEGQLTGLAGLVDAGLLARFHAVEPKITWREVLVPTVGGAAARRRGTPRTRIAHLHDEEARVEVTDRGARGLTIVTDSGPVGALVLLLEMDRRGVAARVTTHAADALPGFSQGALEATWAPAPSAEGLPLRDLVELARFALA